jgi:hypothetical protein
MFYIKEDFNKPQSLNTNVRLRGKLISMTSTFQVPSLTGFNIFFSVETAERAAR